VHVSANLQDVQCGPMPVRVADAEAASIRHDACVLSARSGRPPARG
jgi:hypothetical protein